MTDLVRELGCPQPHAFHHPRILRDCGVVQGIWHGKPVCYRVAPIVQRTSADRQGKALDFGCGEPRFPERLLATAESRALQRVRS